MKEANKEILLRITSLLIGFLFVFSGIAKVIDSDGFIVLLFKYGLGRLAYIAPLLSPVEVILGICLIFNVYIQKASLYVLLLTILFTITFAYAYYFKNIEDCGCFGQGFSIHPLISFIRDVFIIIGSFFIWQNEKQSSVSVWKKIIVLTIGALSFSTAAYTIDNSLWTRLSLLSIEGKLFSKSGIALNKPIRK